MGQRFVLSFPNYISFFRSGDGSSNLPRPSQNSAQRSHPPSMGIRGSQLRNNHRPSMGLSARHEDHRFSHPQQNHAYPSQFPTTAAEMSSPTSHSRQIRMIPIDHQTHNASDGKLTKRSTSLPRKISNEGVVTGENFRFNCNFNSN